MKRLQNIKTHSAYNGNQTMYKLFVKLTLYCICLLCFLLIYNYIVLLINYHKGKQQQQLQ